MRFTDIILSAESGKAFLLGVPPDQGGAPRGGVTQAPKEMEADIKALHHLLVQRGTDVDGRVVRHAGLAFRTTVFQSETGTVFVLRLIAGRVPALAELGFNKRLLPVMTELGKRNGLVLVTGGMGSGKTTTASALLATWLSTYGGFGITCEDPPEYPLEAPYGDGIGLCAQTTVEKGDWLGALAKALRSSARYILLGEIRDEQAARAALRAGINGHLVVATVHGDSVQGSLNMMLQYVTSLEGKMAATLLADGLLCCINQTLVGQPRVPQPEFLFMNHESAATARTMIRNGKVDHLGSEIKRQSNMLLFGGAQEQGCQAGGTQTGAPAQQGGFAPQRPVQQARPVG